MKRYKRHTKEVINQMNVVPYIDVMLVLLVIFMVTAPMFVPGVINLPSVGKSAQINKSPVQIIIEKDGEYSINKDNHVTKVKNIDDLVAQVKNMVNDETPVVISADKDTIYNNVIDVVDKLYTDGIKKVALVVKERNK